MQTQGFQFSHVKDFTNRPGLRNKHGKLITALTDSQLEASQPGELSSLGLPNGNILILEGSAPDNISNIYRDSFKSFK